MTSTAPVTASQFGIQAMMAQQAEMETVYLEFGASAVKAEYCAQLCEHLLENCPRIRTTRDRITRATRDINTAAKTSSSPELTAQALKRKEQKRATKALAKARTLRIRD